MEEGEGMQMHPRHIVQESSLLLDLMVKAIFPHFRHLLFLVCTCSAHHARYSLTTSAIGSISTAFSSLVYNEFGGRAQAPFLNSGW